MPGQQRFVLYTLLILIAAVALYLVGNGSVALWDRDEPRYAQASRQMLQSGDWVVPRYLDDLRTKKPPLIYWCQAAAMSRLGDNAFAARLPSVMAMGLVLVLLAVAVGRAIGRERAMWTVLVFATSLMVVLTAKVCLTDAVLLLWITIGQLCLFAIYRGRASWPVVLTFWVAAGLGALTKGTNLAIHAATLMALAALDVGRDWRSPGAWRSAVAWWKRLRPLAGLAVFAAVVSPWVVLVARREPRFLDLMFRNVGKHVGSSAEGHAMPPGYYLLTVWAFFLPWSVLLPMAVVTGWKRRKLPPVRFALAAVIGPWVFVEMMLSKLPHYLLPAYPPLAFLTADLIVRCLHGRMDDLRRPGFVRGVGVWTVVVVGLSVVPWFAVRRFPDVPVLAMFVLSAAAVLYAGSVFALFLARRPAAALGGMGVGMIGLCAAVFGLYLPRAGFLRTSVHVADVLAAHGVAGPGHPGEPPPALMLDYKEPSLAFYQGGSIREHGATIVTDRLLRSAPRWLVITRDVWEHRGTQATARDRLEVVDTYRGLDVADGMRTVDVMVVRQKDSELVVSRSRTATEADRTGG